MSQLPTDTFLWSGSAVRKALPNIPQLSHAIYSLHRQVDLSANMRRWNDVTNDELRRPIEMQRKLFLSCFRYKAQSRANGFTYEDMRFVAAWLIRIQDEIGETAQRGEGSGAWFCSGGVAAVFVGIDGAKLLCWAGAFTEESPGRGPQGR